MSSDTLKSVPFPVPTIDRPFGVALWPIFEQVYSSITGYLPQDFRFVRGKTPLSTFPETVAVLIAYYVIVLGGRELMKNRPAYKLNGPFMIHNLYLTAISGILLVLYVEELVPTVARRGVFYAICENDGGWTEHLVILYYLNYITKFVELIDTLFLVLKKKPLTFLHTYHHGATALLCYTQLVGMTPISWVPIVLNLLVHVVMYWYYFQSARGIRIWWKEWITRLQIAQFVIDLGFVYFASYTYFTSTYFQWMPNYGHCAGEEFAAFAGMGILSSYLVLFISFYVATYKKAGQQGRKRSNTAKKAVLDMKNMEIPTVGDAREKKPVANGSAKLNGDANASGRNSHGPATRSRKP